MNFTKIWKTVGLPALGLLALPIGLMPTFIMFWRSKPFWPMSVHFTHLWVSGDVWARGLSPYGPAFTETAHQHHVDLPYVYPPNWYPISRFLALFDPNVANWIWFVASIGFVVTVSWLIIASLMRFEQRFSPFARRLVLEIAEPFRTAILTMNRPEARNALSEAMLQGLLEALPRLANDPSVSAVVIAGAGAGAAFCADGDVKGFANTDGDAN